jgi:hypothetical protein
MHSPTTNHPNTAPRGNRTICLPFDERLYPQVVADPAHFRATLDAQYLRTPELFPPAFGAGYQLKDVRSSRKLGLQLRRILLPDGLCYSVRPSFVMPYLSAPTSDVDRGLFLRKFGVPYWAIARVMGRNPMFWYRMQCSLGRASIVGTTVRRAPLPAHLLADEHHQNRQGHKTYLATTVGDGCCLGIEPAQAAGVAELTAAYDVFRKEALHVAPKYKPKTVNTDGWSGTQGAWKSLFPKTVLILCFLHAWLSIRDRGKHLGDLFLEVSRRVWDAYRAPTRRSFAQRLRSLRAWASAHLSGIVQDKTLALCNKRSRFAVAYRHPGCHRTSNMLDRVMRSMHRYFFDGQHLHGSLAASRLHARGWALLWNFAPWHPAVSRSHGNWRSPAELLNQHRYHQCWLQNLLISSSLGGYRVRPRSPQNP